MEADHSSSDDMPPTLPLTLLRALSMLPKRLSARQVIFIRSYLFRDPNVPRQRAGPTWRGCQKRQQQQQQHEEVQGRRCRTHDFVFVCTTSHYSVVHVVHPSVSNHTYSTLWIINFALRQHLLQESVPDCLTASHLCFVCLVNTRTRGTLSSRHAPQNLTRILSFQRTLGQTCSWGFLITFPNN